MEVVPLVETAAVAHILVSDQQGFVETMMETSRVVSNGCDPSPAFVEKNVRHCFGATILSNLK